MKYIVSCLYLVLLVSMDAEASQDSSLVPIKLASTAQTRLHSLLTDMDSVGYRPVISLVLENTDKNEGQIIVKFGDNSIVANQLDDKHYASVQLTVKKPFSVYSAKTPLCNNLNLILMNDGIVVSSKNLAQATKCLSVLSLDDPLKDALIEFEHFVQVRNSNT